MGITVVCQSCGNRRTVPASLYEEKIRGKVVRIACKACGSMISVDGTVPPPADPNTPITEDLMNLLEPEVPPMARIPSQLGADAGGPMEPVPAAREKLISHVDGPISERGPSATVGRYALFEQFATGGMATVHFGRLDGAGGFSRVVAIKRLLPHLVQNNEFTEMLLKEARLAARVRHPNVASTLDVVATKGDVLLVLDYVHGEALSTLCRKQAKEKKEQVPLPIAIGIILDMLQGLAAIHDATDEKGRSLGLVHRDISPPNVLVGADGAARVLDFGIATALEHIEEKAPERRKGKRGYMSPEQLRGERLTQRSDVFSTGVVMWELLALRRLFPADQEKEPGEVVLRGNYPRIRDFRVDFSGELDAIVMKALEFEPSARYATMHELFDAFEAAAPARANARRIGEWVGELAKEALAERMRMVARAENWFNGEDLPLKSAPFTAELPLRPRSPSSRPPAPREVVSTAIPASVVPPLPPSVSSALKARESSLPPAAPTKAADAAVAAPLKSGSRWWAWGLLLLAMAAYFALRSG